MQPARRFVDEAEGLMAGVHAPGTPTEKIVRPAFGATRPPAAGQRHLSGALDVVGRAAQVIWRAHERVTALEAEMRRVQQNCAETVRLAEARGEAADQRASSAERRALDQLRLAEQRLKDAQLRVADAETRAAEAEQALRRIERHIRACFSLPATETR